MTEITEIFDFVIVAAGHHNMPHVPEYPGIKDCQRIKVLHSIDWKSPFESTGKTIFLLGGSYSAEDLASLSWRAGAKHVYISSRKPLFPQKGWPDNVTQVPCLKQVDVNPATGVETLVLEDGQRIEGINELIFCTGYEFYVPCLEPSLSVVMRNDVYVKHLYHGMFLTKHPRLIMIGA